MSSKLCDLAATIVEELPMVIERSVRHDVEISILNDQCKELQSRIGLAKEGIALERDKQKHLRAQIAHVKGPAASVSGGIRESKLYSSRQSR